jgi:hypothetical protein
VVEFIASRCSVVFLIYLFNGVRHFGGRLPWDKHDDLGGEQLRFPNRRLKQRDYAQIPLNERHRLLATVEKARAISVPAQSDNSRDNRRFPSPTFSNLGRKTDATAEVR